MLTIHELVSDNADKIPFTWVAGADSANRLIPDVGMSGADLVGHLNLIHPSRIQVFGTEELSYYIRFDIRRRLHHLDDMVAGGVPAIILADDVTPPDDLIDYCNVHNVPLLMTTFTAEIGR